MAMQIGKGRIVHGMLRNVISLSWCCMHTCGYPQSKEVISRCEELQGGHAPRQDGWQGDCIRVHARKSAYALSLREACVGKWVSNFCEVGRAIASYWE